LVHEAVSKPTVLPVTYTVVENIGDRISRLSTPKPVEFYNIQPKIPQSELNGTSTDVSSVEGSAIDYSEHIAALVQEAVSKPTVLPTAYTIPEDIGDRISRLTTPKSVDADIVQSKTAEPDSESILPPKVEPQPSESVDAESIQSKTAEPDSESTPVPTVEPHSSESVDAESIQSKTAEPDSESTPVPTVEPQPSEVDLKKSFDDTDIEASTPATVVAEAPILKEAHDSVVGVVEPLEVEETSNEQASPPAVVEPVAIEETTEDKTDTVVAAESAEVEQTTDNETPVAKAEPTRVPNLLDQVSSLVETVSTVFKKPEADQKDSEPVDDPSQLDPAATETPTKDTVEPLTTDTPALEAEDAQAPSLLDRVSLVVEAVAATLKGSDVDNKNSEASVESVPAADQQFSGSKTVEITCPKCESTDLRKNGRRQGKQKYVCKTCGQQFVNPDAAEAEEQPKIETSSPVETLQPKGSQADTGVSDSTPGSSKHHSKKKAKAKGFGGSKKAK
jgi:predicted RNA-binding Zn-ribbon protein involved in translation (DUF1610 family)